MQKVKLFDRISNGDNQDEDKFDMKTFKRVLRHIFSMKDGNKTIDIEDESEIKNSTYCLYSGPRPSEKFEYQFLANFYGEIPFYSLYNE